MKKKLLLNLLFLIVIFFITGCHSEEMYDKNDITITIKNGSLTKTGATIIITDISGQKNTYSDWFRIEKNNNGWKKLEGNDSWFNLNSYYIDENNQIIFEHNWKDIYGELDDGKYRLVKKVDNKYISVDFTID